MTEKYSDNALIGAIIDTARSIRMLRDRKNDIAQRRSTLAVERDDRMMRHQDYSGIVNEMDELSAEADRIEDEINNFGH